MRYEIRWESSEPTSPGGAVPAAAFLLIGDDAGIIESVMGALTAAGHRHRVLGLPGSDADEQALIDGLRTAAEEEPGLRILNLAALTPVGGSPMRSLLRMQHHVLGGTQRLFRAAAAAGIRLPIWVITRGAQRVIGSDTVAPEQTSLWGFCRVAALEYPQIWGGLADLTAGGTDEWRELVDRLATASPDEDQVALRAHAVHVPRLVRRSGNPHPESLQLRSDATYLVTGGLGALGLEIAGYLASHGAGQLVLTSRRAPGATATARIEALQDLHGCAIRVIAADVADPHDVARLLATLQAELPPLAGIVHAAGENSTTDLGSLDNAEVDRVFAGKVWGAWYLSEAVVGLPLDFFVCTSSIAAVWGSFGQSAYSAANAFLDGLTWRLREQGIPGISINFGPWSAGHGRPGRPRTAGAARYPNPVTRRRPGRDGRRHGRRPITGNRAGRGGADRLGPIPADLPSGGSAFTAGRGGRRSAGLGRSGG